MTTHDLRGKVFLVTGAAGGIGLVTARELARAGARVVLACRTEARAAPALAEIRAAVPGAEVEPLALDLARLDAVRAGAAAFLARGLPLHGLVNNAGLASSRATTAEGFELAFGVNHLGHFLLTGLLRDRLVASAPSRIVNVASRAHRMARRIDWEALRGPQRSRAGLEEYAVSKLCNLLFTRELARRLAGTGVTANSLHPGVVATDIWRRLPWGLRHLVKLFMIGPEEGAQATLRLCADPALAGATGRYWEEARERHPSWLAQDDALAAELWRRSAEWTGLAG